MKISDKIDVTFDHHDDVIIIRYNGIGVAMIEGYTSGSICSVPLDKEDDIELTELGVVTVPTDFAKGHNVILQY